ncbi:Short-chain dehydrogenase reductase ATR9 [Hyphodiscus hymeniophilus]|uniref:Short-chain dehydrogenase reductase ATR9 n=1 Tax=Hyphodiscus hymeniophilus TaxID=353542 RepID=A0A9P6VL98_9HELO|nr:Short-chain dehydrogenase reductase ATR9 [Hyphodiscus hymeniophilus]
MPSIKSQSVLIIGGSSGIGFAVAQGALSQGAIVAIASSNPQRISTAVSKLTSSNPSLSSAISGHVCDLSVADVESNLLTLLNAVTQDGTRLLDHVVNTAIDPFGGPSSLAQVGRDELLAKTQFSLVVPMLIAKLAPSFMKGGFTSSLILTSGQIGLKPIKGWVVEVPGAAALFGMVKGLALELAPRRVNLVSPGATITELWGPLEAREERAEMLKGRMLLGRVGQPDEVAEAYIYLMRNWNSTGTVVCSDGGSILM